MSARRRRLALPAVLVGSFVLVAGLFLSNGPLAPAGGPELAAPGGAASSAASSAATDPVDVGHGVRVGMNVRHDTSRPLRDVPPDPVKPLPADGENDQGGPVHAAQSAHDPVVQAASVASTMPATTLNFDGIGFPGVNCNCAPPDTNGEAGATQYVQIVNEGFQVFDKATGAVKLGPVGITTIWNNFGGVCQSGGMGDPVVLWDQLAGRWLVSQFAGSTVPTDECIAISTTGDATGTWYRYDFHLGSNFYDYPKLAVWPDGYYMSDNVFNSRGTSYYGPQPFVFDRASMLAGKTATFQTTSAPLGSSIDPILPADLEGSTAPPANAPETFVRFPGGGAYQTYHYHVDWVTPSNSTFTTFASPAAAGFTALCPTTRSCVPQLGTTSGLDALADRLMFRLTYRNFPDHESVVGTYTVSSGGVAGIRWFELRNVTSGPETVHQESTYQPDTTWRWMGSAAMDKAGDIAIGFSASSSSIYPQLRYAARAAGDPLNTLGQGEATLYAGTGSQTGTSNRWGDYSDMSVDPSNGCTFWYTSEYYSTTTSFGWQTRIGTFTLPACTGTSTGSIAGHVTDSATSAAIAGATVSLSTGATTTTDGSGAYAFGGLNPATYTVTASATGYTTSAPASVAVTAGTTATQDFALVSSSTASVPGAPNLTAATAKGKGIQLTWVAPSSNGSAITAYKVYRGTSSGGETSLTTLGVVTSYKDTSTTRGATYWYYVTAVNAVGESPDSNEAHATAK